MAEAPLDLSQLALGRPAVTTAIKPRRRRWLTRYVLPIGMLVGFLGLLVAEASRRLLPQPSVTVVPVIVKRAEVQQAGTALFQSPGWIEPRPTAINVAALAPGVIEELLVVEGQQVSKGEQIARLISIDAELDVEQAKISLGIREGELNRARAELEAAKIRHENPLHLEVELADALSSLAKAKTELAKLPYMIDAAQANADYAKDSVLRKKSAPGAVSGNVIALAESDHADATATLQELLQRKPNLQREVDALAEKVAVRKRQIKLLVEETRQVREAEAKVQSAEALRDEARLQVRQAELMLERNIVRAPMHGRVMRLVASPGTRVMGAESTTGQSSSTVVEMYDPGRLQVRADVRLEDVPLITRGQPVDVETASSSGPIKGQVLQATSSANIQKNTLEVKIELLDPPSTVSPNMLVTATFLAPLFEKTANAATQIERIFVPDQLVKSGESGTYVWVVDANKRAQRRPVETGSAIPGGLMEIKAGLNVTDKLIAGGLDGVYENGPVDVTGDDQIMGIK